MTATEAIEQFINRGGWVMWPLLALSLCAMTLIFERTIFWSRTHSGAARRRTERLIGLLAEGKTDQARGLADEDQTLYGDLIRLLLQNGTGEAATTAAIERQRQRLYRFMPTLGTIITAAPMLGILGTVIGIISSFEVLSAKELSTKPAEVGAGIAEALLTTVAGLVVAIVTLFPYNAFRAQIDRVYGRIDTIIASARDGAGDRDASAENPNRDSA
ncbi:MAG: MotA/TolQ/ExbB proton channel family protein [Phycisphaeraceae bacterium]|nr:MotA/TolQ/ExbB proton channel family protein [Phycisphaeraceae bacterium]